MPGHGSCPFSLVTPVAPCSSCRYSLLPSLQKLFEVGFYQLFIQMGKLRLREVK